MPGDLEFHGAAAAFGVDSSDPDLATLHDRVSHPEKTRAIHRAVREASPSMTIAEAEISLDTLIPDSPNKPYDMRELIVKDADDGDFFELQPGYRGPPPGCGPWAWPCHEFTLAVARLPGAVS